MVEIYLGTGDKSADFIKWTRPQEVKVPTTITQLLLVKNSGSEPPAPLC